MSASQELLETSFGLASFLPGQEQVIENLLAGGGSTQRAKWC